MKQVSIKKALLASVLALIACGAIAVVPDVWGEGDGEFQPKAAVSSLIAWVGDGASAASTVSMFLIGLLMIVVMVSRRPD